MAYSDYVEKLFRENGWEAAAERFNSLTGKKVLIFTHDDPDGLTSGCLLKRIVELKGGIAEVRLPETYELEESRLEKELGAGDFSMVILADKGTMGYYGQYASKVEDFIVIDHHPPIGMPEGIYLINPNTSGYNLCSTSFLAHMLMTYLGEGEEYDDYLALLGLKGDWGVEPATDFVSPYVREFYEERISGSRLAGLVEKIESRPTMFEVNQRLKTTLINQIAELFFALGGGGFQYFYNSRESALADTDQAEFSFQVLDSGREGFSPETMSSLDDFIKNCGKEDTVRKIYGYFLQDWEKATGIFSSSSLLTGLGETDIYLFLGYRVALMPMAGSVYLSELKKLSGGKEVVFIMINREASGGIHFSLRGTTAKVHAGKICAGLSKRLVEAYGHGGEITGGGHFVAAECKTRNSGVTLAQALGVFSGLIMEMEEAAAGDDAGRASELGLEYMAERQEA